MAINNNDRQRVIDLIRRGADVNLLDSQGKLPIRAAIEVKGKRCILFIKISSSSRCASLMDVAENKRDHPVWQRIYREDGCSAFKISLIKKTKRLGSTVLFCHEIILYMDDSRLFKKSRL